MMKDRARRAAVARVAAVAMLASLAACSDPAVDLVPAIASVPPPVPPSQIVFFDAGTASISADGAEVLGRAVKDYARLRPSQVTVVGHADRLGGGRQNVALSAERAEAVRRHLVAEGIPESVVVAVAAGEGEGLVGTPDGTAEAQNRRAEVYMVTEFAGRQKRARTPWQPPLRRRG